MAAGRSRPAGRGRSASRVSGVGVGTRKLVEQDGVDDLFEMAFGDGAMAVAVGDHLALLGHAQAAVDGSARLGEDGAVGRAAAAADRRRRGRGTTARSTPARRPASASSRWAW